MCDVSSSERENLMVLEVARPDHGGNHYIMGLIGEMFHQRPDTARKGSNGGASLSPLPSQKKHDRSYD